MSNKQKPPAPIDAGPDPYQTLAIAEQAERAVVFGWLAQAAQLIRQSARYMSREESRFSEDIFDDLRIIEEKIDRYSNEVLG